MVSTSKGTPYSGIDELSLETSEALSRVIER